MFHFGARWVRADPAKGSFSAGSKSAYIAGETHWLGRALSRPHHPSEIACVGISVPAGVTRDKTQLWQVADQMERRKDGEYQRRAGKAPRVAIHIDAALPRGLTTQQAEAATETFAAALVDRFGVIAQWAVHNKLGSANDHIHILMSTRRFAETDFGRKVRELDGIAARQKELAEGRPLIVDTRSGKRQISGEMEWMRSTWAELISQFTTERIDHRSFARQGLHDEPVTIFRRGEIEYQKRLERRGAPHVSWRQTREEELRAREATSWFAPLLTSGPKLSSAHRSRARRDRLRQRYREELTPLQAQVVAADVSPRQDALVDASFGVDSSIASALPTAIRHSSSLTCSRKTNRRRARMRERSLEPPTADFHELPLVVVQPERNRSDRLISDQSSARRARLRLHHAAATLDVAAAEERSRQFQEGCIKGLKKRGNAILLAKIKVDGRHAADLEPKRLTMAMQRAIGAQIEEANQCLEKDGTIVELFRRMERERQSLCMEMYRTAAVLARAGKSDRKARLKASRFLYTLQKRRRDLENGHENEVRALRAQTMDRFGQFPSWAEVSGSVRPIQPSAYSLYPVFVADPAAPARAPQASKRLEFEDLLGETAYRMHVHSKLTWSRMVAISDAANLDVNDLARAVQRWAEGGATPRNWGDLALALAGFGRKGQHVSELVASVQVAHQHPTRPSAKSEKAVQTRTPTKLPEF